MSYYLRNSDPLMCYKCNNIYSSKQRLKLHRCTESFKHQCDICQKKFKTIDSLYDHRSRVHKDQIKKQKEIKELGSSTKKIKKQPKIQHFSEISEDEEEESEEFMYDIDLASLDIETTGLVKDDMYGGIEFVQFSLIQVRDIDNFTTLINQFYYPQNMSTKSAYETHSRSNESLHMNPKFKIEHANTIINWFKRIKTILCFNKPSEIEFIKQQFKRCGAEIDESVFDKFIDVQQVVIKSLGKSEFSHLSLGGCAAIMFHELDKSGLHNALFDAQLTANVYLKVQGNDEEAQEEENQLQLKIENDSD